MEQRLLVRLFDWEVSDAATIPPEAARDDEERVLDAIIVRQFFVAANLAFIYHLPLVVNEVWKHSAFAEYRI